MLQIHSILAPVDFSDHAREALAVSRALAAQFGAHLDLLHVIEEPAFPSFYKTGAAALYGEAPDLHDQAHAALKQLIEDVRGEDVKHGVGYHVQQGEVAKSITAFAEEQGTDLIVIASHGLTGLRHYLLGSVAEKVVRQAPCPVLVLKVFDKPLLPEARIDPAEPTSA